MAPKALTDCPENLREAIDWLLQVKSGDGISTLSDALGKLFDNAVQDAENSLSSLPESDEPSARDVISRLQGFRSTLPKDSANLNQNILHRLCSSVANFVGYKPPGTYDGSGIVYGDASRLCDAVVSFLHRVIRDVRDNQPYVVGGALLSGLVGDLEKARWSGHHGFKAVVSSVASGLGIYNENVKASNDRVKRPISDIIDYVKDEGGELPPKISKLNETNPSDTDVNEAEALTKACVEKGKDFGKAFASKTHKHYMKDAFDDLNASLRDKIHNARLSVAREAAMLNRWSKKQLENYKAMVKLIKQAFRKLRENINSRIKKEVTDLVESLKGLVKNILAKLENISKTLGKIISDLDNWMTEAEEILDAALKLVQNTYDELDDTDKTKDKLDKAIERVEEKLEQRVQELNTWKSAVDSVIRNAIKNSESVHTALDKERDNSTFGKNIGHIEDANKEISQANNDLGQRVSELGQWKEAADTILESVISESNKVRGKLEHKDSSSTTIAQGVQKINAAKEKVTQVDTKLVEVGRDLQTWNSAARSVLGTAVGKARDVHGRLDHTKTDNGHILGKKISEIDEAKKGIEEANKVLEQQVGNLNTWISTAEGIRAAAEQKAKEAYEKLEPHKALSEKIGEVVQANEKIKRVHTQLSGVEKSLGEWKQEATNVLAGAIENANYVYDKLDPNEKDVSKGFIIGHNIEHVSSNNKHIMSANQALAGEVDNIGKWRDTAKDVITKAEGKCGKILEKVKTDPQGKESEIYKEAQLLKKKAENLLNAYSQAHRNFKNLKKAVPAAIEQLEGEMKNDLVRLQKEIVGKMIEHVGSILNDIKGRVEQIKGNGSSGTGLEGIKQGVQNYYNFFQGTFDKAVGGWIDDILGHNGLIKKLLEWQGKGDEELKKDLENSGLGGFIKEPLTVQVTNAVHVFTSGQSFADSIEKKIEKVKDACELFALRLEQELEKDVNSGVLALALKAKEAMVNEVHEPSKKSHLQSIIANANCECDCRYYCKKGNPDRCQKCEQPKCNLTQAVATTLVTVSSVARQVGKELHSVLLGNGTGMGDKSIAGELDSVARLTRTLDKNLEDAEKEAKNGPQPSTPSNQGNNILQKVTEIEGKVKEGMKDDVTSGITVAKTMSLYEKTKTTSGSAYKTLIDTTIPNAMQPFKQMAEFKNQPDQQKQLEIGEVKDAKGLINYHFTEIKDELEQIAHIVNSNIQTSHPTSGAKDGVKNYLGDLEQMVKHAAQEDYQLDSAVDPQHKNVQGLAAIQDRINKLHTGEFRKTAEITTAVQGLQNEIKTLRGKLKKEQDVGAENGVVDVLKEMRGKGLSSDKDWQGKDKKVSGLGKIEESLKGENGRLDKETKSIDTAIKKLRWQLTVLGFKLDNGLVDDDLMDQLKKLKNEIDKGGKGGLQAIYNAISGLQKGQFADNPNKIGAAMSPIKTELTALQKALKGANGNKDDVITRLTELQTDGLGEKEDWQSDNNGTKKGLGLIEKDLNTQQKTLNTQPGDIDSGVDQITGELDRLQSDLQDKVTKKLTMLKNKGLTNSEQEWEVDDKKHNGLAKITNDIKELKENEFTSKPIEITQHIGQIKNELDEQRNKLEREVTARLRDLQSKGLADGEWNLGSQKISGLEKITNGISDIKAENVEDVKHKLSILRGVIKYIARDIRDSLTQLKDNMIGNRLRKIRDDLQQLHISLVKGAIKDCEGFINADADVFKQRCIDELTHYVNQELNAEKNKLLAEARRQYVSTVKEMLSAFAAKVESELEELPGNIDRDLTIGFKGFTRQMEDGTTDDVSTEKGNNINKLVNVKYPKDVSALSSAFMKFFGPLKDYVKNETKRVHDEESKKENPSLSPPAEPYALKLYEVNAAINTVLIHIQDIQGFDHRLPQLLAALTKALSEMKPEAFGKITTPLLDTVGRGLRDFAAEFGDAYVSAYSGAECREADADKYAKVLLSFTPMVHEALNHMVDKCGTNWRGNKICKLTGDGRDNGLGNYLTRCGYKVSTTDGLQEGELQNHFSGGAVYELLKSPVADVSVKMLIGGEPPENGINVVDIVGLFHNMLCRYLQACHLKVHASPRYPCTVRDMLSWLSGLQYTPVVDKLTDHCRALLNRKCDNNDVPNRDDAVMAQCINNLPYDIANSCSHANSLLIAIQGHGRGFDLAAYPYSVDLANNRAQLYYPADPEELLDMMTQIVCRLCRVLYFLYAQCCRDAAKTKGWRQCHYGRQVPSSHWQCNPLNKQATEACHNCPPTSPLQSFLSDSCPNLLPHKLTVVDNAIECANCPGNLPGQQCLTPLGFWDLSLAASMRRTGKELSKSLGRLCSDADACLFQLCRTLRLLCPSAPQSLGDMLVLFTQLLKMWDHESYRGAYSPHESYISHLNGDAINGLFPLWTELHGSYLNSNLTDALKALADHDHEKSEHNALSSLSAEPPCQAPAICAPFLQPLALHANHTFPQKHAQLYISWVVWLAWQLWDLLESLLDALNNIDCTAHGCATCLCQPGNHGDKDACHCPSIVECGGPLPTLYRYGFTYRNAHVDLNAQLTKALHSDRFAKLFHQIDQLLWHIRAPFLFTTIALWLTATLYILHSLLYRMDVLHIRSHLLTTRASHLIDVKALLAGSRRMLSLYNDVDYFDDEPVDMSQ
ncbi:Extracellular matrix-binding ebh [Babesia ovata]|uniref:Extracellular matrix-binding ebh n=1 Tax=Babesia ovata TaxID=189622 RepID=A0A2H6K7P8_9APIC|nr:Extracellular matrix-binding ebh [Babesia ovata]GBE59015.1 Extracellular matrix-binding ebh [Babesia ovata]